MATNATLWSIAFNTALESALSVFVNTNADVTLYALDIFSAFGDYQAGNINQWDTTTGDWAGTDAWGELFWTDGFHPSSEGHALIAGLATSAVPEPATALLFGIGILSLAGVTRRRK